MRDNEYVMNSILEQLKELPVGNITRKTIRGKTRMYLQWREEGKTKSRYIKASEEAEILAAVELRKKLEEEYQALRCASYAAAPLKVREEASTWFRTHVVTGEDLLTVCDRVSGFKERECIRTLKTFLKSDVVGKVCLIYGLRRTGKTTLVLQAMAELPKEKTAYIKIMSSDTMADLNKDLKALSDQGIQYVFIDEVTLMEDFIDGASLLSDVYAMFGMKIVLSGTDSLGFAISADEELYDRAITIHTTFIPFREYSRLLGIHDVDEYIRYGGTFRLGETDFDNKSHDESIPFENDESTRKYIDTAIARNIQHSLACYKDGGHFRHLVDLYEKDELTNAVNRIIEDMNHRFLLSVLTRDFKSHDLGSSAQIQRKKTAIKGERNILDEIDTAAVTAKLMEILDIRNKDQLSVAISEDHIGEIREYLRILDLIVPCPKESILGESVMKGYLFSQPGMRYCQAQALVYALMKDDNFRRYPAKERKQIENQILEEVRGRILEEIVLLETIKTLPSAKRAFKLQFPVGEYDMVIQNVADVTCEIYEIKHTDRVFPAQYKHLTDPEKLAQTEHEYGEITGKVVLYRGPDQVVGDITYKNAVTYLEGLGNI